MKRKVRVTGPGVKLNNIWCYINEEAVIDEKQYKENEKYVEVIEEIEETKTEDIKPAAPVVQKEPVEEKEKMQEDNNPESNEKTENDEQTEDEELEALKEKAKKLGIKNAHNMKKETLIAKIEEAKAGEGQNPEGE
ncbi:unknown [Clostridium sp. CAG:354]|jgi:hypothetical protein|nr:unknown [Clostridium sp. CAG:354]